MQISTHSLLHKKLPAFFLSLCKNYLTRSETTFCTPSLLGFMFIMNFDVYVCAFYFVDFNLLTVSVLLSLHCIHFGRAGA